MRLRNYVNRVLSQATGKPIEKVTFFPKSRTGIIEVHLHLGRATYRNQGFVDFPHCHGCMHSNLCKRYLSIRYPGLVSVKLA